MIGRIERFLLVSLLCLAWSSCSAIARDALQEYTIKAGFLYNFALLTEWPENSLGETFEVCLFGKQDFETALEALSGKQIDNRRINIRQLEGPGEAQMCNILFVAEIERKEMYRVMKTIASQPVLVVTDDESLVKLGAMIFIRPEKKRLVFEIDADLTNSANLKISARLLRLTR